MNHSEVVDVVEEAVLRERGSYLFRRGNLRIALFQVGQEIYAVDNRCPHEGYPLKAGTINEKKCTLTCQWHNWKFDLKTGRALKGEDAVGVYPVRIEQGRVLLEITEVPLEQRKAKIMHGLKEAVAERQYGRMAREITRLVTNDIDPKEALIDVIKHAYDRFEWGMNHAFAGAAEWLRVAATRTEKEDRIICFTEAIDHIADDTLRQRVFPFTEDIRSFEGKAFLAAVEAQEEASAVAMIRGALRDGMTWKDLDYWFSRAALMHYTSFGHSLIYVYKTGILLEHLGDTLLPYLLLPLTRHLCYGTREDLLPEFKAYAGQLAAEATGMATDSYLGLSVNQALAGAANEPDESAYDRLLAANAYNLLHFNLSFQSAYDRPVSQNASWLDTTHGITFSNAVRVQCTKFPELWRAGLLQMACFIGRNKTFLDQSLDVSQWKVADHETFFEETYDKLLDHGLIEPIYSVHLLKTALAVEEELPFASPETAALLLDGLNRFLHSPLKEKHARRMARQALALVEG